MTKEQAAASSSISSGMLWALRAITILLLAYGLRVWGLDKGDLGFDEVATFFVSNRSLAGIIEYTMRASREHPPLSYILTSLWFKVAGTEEFAVRYPSVLISLLVAAWSVHLGRKFLGREGGWWAGLLLAVMPFSIDVGRTARMYPLVTLLALVTIEAWLCWRQKPTLKRWGIFLTLSLAGALTHYYLVFLWVVEGAMLICFPTYTRRIRWPWLLTVLTGALILAVIIAASPGMLATLEETGSRFPARTLRLHELKGALMDLYINWHHATLWPVVSAGLALTALGWALLWKKSRPTAGLLTLWATLPTAIVVLIPETIRARYLIEAFPALVLGLASTITLLRPHLLRVVAALLILAQFVTHWDHAYADTDTSFSKQVTRLHQLAQPGDGLVFNGPWPAFLLNYYKRPEYLAQYSVPQSAPPGFNAEVDIPRLEGIAAAHERVWVSYGTVDPADPDFRVSLWFAENMYDSYKFRDLRLYLPEPETMQTFPVDLEFGEQIHIEEVSLNTQEVALGETLLVRLACECEDVNWRTLLRLGLLDPEGNLWDNYEFYIGPKHHADSTMPEDWVERRGLWLNTPGLPPGEYTLALRVRDESGGVIIEEESGKEWAPLQQITVVSAQEAATPPPPGEEIPTWAGAQVTFDESLSLVGLNPESTYVLQGSPLAFEAWWRSDAPVENAQLHVRLVGPRSTEVQSFDPAPTFYPVDSWKTGEIIRQEFSYPIPNNLPGGKYHVQIQMTNDDGTPLSLNGSRDPLTFWERIKGPRVAFEGDWADLYIVMVGERERDYRLPLFLKKNGSNFGNILSLAGYRLGKSTLRAGQSTQLVEYWQALASPGQRYAVFNHLVSPDGTTIIWQQDSWPQGGQYTTEYWVAGEVVDETYTLTIPEGTPPGEYTLYTGVYDPKTVIRLQAFDPQGQQYLNDMVPLLTIAVVP